MTSFNSKSPKSTYLTAWPDPCARKIWIQVCSLKVRSVLPEKVHFAIELPVPGKALLRQVAAAVAALHALGVPGSVQHVEQEPVQDGPLAAGAQDHHVSGLQGAESRPSHSDCVARTGAARLCAEQRLGSGRSLLCRRKPVTIHRELRRGVPAPGAHTIHNPAESGGDCPPQSRAGNTIAGHSGVIPPSLRERSPHVATFTSLCLRGLSRGSASATRVQSADWRTASLIPVPGEPIRAQLLWLRAPRLQAGPGARRNTCVRVFFTSAWVTKDRLRVRWRWKRSERSRRSESERFWLRGPVTVRSRRLAGWLEEGPRGPFSCTDLFTGKCTRISCSSSTGEPAPQPAVQRNLNIYQQTRAVSCTKANMRRANSSPSPPLQWGFIWMTLGVNFRPFSAQTLDKEQSSSSLKVLKFTFKLKQTFLPLKTTSLSHFYSCKWLQLELFPS